MTYEFTLLIDGPIIERLRVLFSFPIASIESTSMEGPEREFFDQCIEAGLVKEVTTSFRFGETHFELTKVGREFCFETPLLGRIAFCASCGQTINK